MEIDVAIPERELSFRIAFRLILPVIAFSLFFDLLAGYFLGSNFDKLMTRYPILLIIIPGVMGLRGNVFGAMGSRISTALYLGSSRATIKDEFVLRNVFFSVWAATIPALILLFIALLRFLSTSNLAVVEIIINSSVTQGVLLSVATAGIVILSFRRNIDPDSIVGPSITTFADLISIPTLIFFIMVFERTKLSTPIFVISIIILSLSMFLSFKGASKDDLRIYKEVLTIISALAMIQAITGNVLHDFSGTINRIPFLAFAYPAILGSTGNYGSIIVARTSTKLHLGEIERFSYRDLKDAVTIFSTSLVIAPTIFTISNLFSALHGNQAVLSVDAAILFISFYFPLVFIMLIFSFVLSIFLYRVGVDPDNGGIPLVTTLSDVVATVVIVWMAASMATMIS